jgi:hypothetical protein
MKMYGGSGYSFTILIIALDEGKWSALHPGQFTSGERALDTHCVGGWVGPRASLDALEKKNLVPARNQTPTVHCIILQINFVLFCFIFAPFFELLCLYVH